MITATVTFTQLTRDHAGMGRVLDLCDLCGVDIQELRLAKKGVEATVQLECQWDPKGEDEASEMLGDALGYAEQYFVLVSASRTRFARESAAAHYWEDR